MIALQGFGSPPCPPTRPPPPAAYPLLVGPCSSSEFCRGDILEEFSGVSCQFLGHLGWFQGQDGDGSGLGGKWCLFTLMG